MTASRIRRRDAIEEPCGDQRRGDEQVLHRERAAREDGDRDRRASWTGGAGRPARPPRRTRRSRPPTPSLVSGPVVQSRMPLEPASPAARIARPRSMSSRPAAVHRDGRDGTGEHREQARRVQGLEPGEVREADQRAGTAVPATRRCRGTGRSPRASRSPQGRSHHRRSRGSVGAKYAGIRSRIAPSASSVTSIQRGASCAGFVPTGTAPSQW